MTQSRRFNARSVSEIVKPTLLLTAFTLGLVLGNRSGRQALYAELTEAFPEFCSANEPRVHVNGGFVQPYCNG